MRPTTRRGFSASIALAAVLTLSTSGVAAADTVPTEDPVEAAAGWLADALVDGERLQSEFDGEFYDQPGATADAVYALASAGVAADSIDSATDWLEGQAAVYSGGEGVSTGAVGKLLLVAATTDRDPRDFGGVDLVEKLEDAEVTDPADDDAEDLPGRYRDVSDFGDFSTPLTHSLALLGLGRTGEGAPSDASVQLLLDQQCDDGGFSGSFLVATDVAPEPECASSVDTTGYAVQALDLLGRDEAVSAGVAWLETAQQDNGGFGSADGIDTNSTGLAAAALSVAGGDAATIADARSFVLDAQDGCDGEEPGAIAFSTTDRGFVGSATAQAIPGLVGVSLAEVDASGASTDVPRFDCPGESEPGDGGQDDDAGTDPGTDEVDDAEAAPADDGEIEQPARVDAGISPSGSPVALPMTLAMLTGIALLAFGVTRRRGDDRA